MARFGRYEDAVALTQRLDLLDVAVVMRELDVNATVAEAFLKRLVEDGILFPPDSPGGAYKATRGGRRRSWSEVTPSSSGRAGEQAAAGRDEWERKVNSLSGRVRELEFELAGWRRRAMAAEASLARSVPRIELLRRRLAKVLHPDSAGGDLTELALREELFKRLWPRIEEALGHAEAAEDERDSGAA
ncbi:MAG: hypothetical protein ACK4PG_05985 [Acetobacteraceae bacterium]